MYHSKMFYFNYLTKCKISSEEKINEHLSAFQRGDTKAVDYIIDSFQPLVYKLSKVYMTYNSLEFMDLVQEANLVILSASKTYKLSSQMKFKTYLYYKMKYRLIDYTKEHSDLIHMSSYMRDKYSSYNLSLSVDSYEDGLGDLILSDNLDGLDPETTYYYNERKNIINKYLNLLKPRNKEMIKYRFGFYNNTEYKLDEIGLMFNISKSAVSQAISKGLRELKHKINVSSDLHRTCA